MEAGRELDRIVAEKVMGWVVKGGTAYDPVGGAWDASREWLPYYSTDMSDAWLVVEKHTSAYPFMLSYREDHRDWFVCFDPINRCVEIANTAPLAICLAALKAVGVKSS